MFLSSKCAVLRLRKVGVVATLSPKKAFVLLFVACILQALPLHAHRVHGQAFASQRALQRLQRRTEQSGENLATEHERKRLMISQLVARYGLTLLCAHGAAEVTNEEVDGAGWEAREFLISGQTTPALRARRKKAPVHSLLSIFPNVPLQLQTFERRTCNAIHWSTTNQPLRTVVLLI